MRLQDPKRISRLLEIPAQQQQHTPVAGGQIWFPIKRAGCTGRVAVIVNRGMLRTAQSADASLVRPARIVATRVQHCQAWKRSHVHPSSRSPKAARPGQGNVPVSVCHLLPLPRTGGKAGRDYASRSRSDRPWTFQPERGCGRAAVLLARWMSIPSRERLPTPAGAPDDLPHRLAGPRRAAFGDRELVYARLDTRAFFKTKS